MKTLNLLFFVLFATFSLESFAGEITKCVDSKGKVTFSEGGCAPESNKSTVKIWDSSSNADHIYKAKARSVREKADEEIVSQREYQRDSQENARSRAAYECKEATEKYEAMHNAQLRSKKYMSAQGIALTPEAVLVRTKCGAEALPVPDTPPSNVITNNGQQKKQILGTDGEVYNPAAGGYTTSKGQFCSDAAGGMMCNGQFIPRR